MLGGVGLGLYGSTVWSLAFRVNVLCCYCVPGPSLAWLYILTFVAIVGLGVYAAYYLNKRRINRSALAIGMDYMQVRNRHTFYVVDLSAVGARTGPPSNAPCPTLCVHCGNHGLAVVLLLMLL